MSDLLALQEMLRRAGYKAEVLKPAGPGAPNGATQTLMVFVPGSKMERGADWHAHFNADDSLATIATIPDGMRCNCVFCSCKGFCKGCNCVDCGCV